MKTLEEIKNEVAEIYLYNDFKTALYLFQKGEISQVTFDGFLNQIVVDACKEALKNASDKSQLMMYYIDEEDTTNVDILNFKHRRIQSCYAVPKQSILNESNIPKL